LQTPPTIPLKVFYAYCRADAKFRTELDQHLVDLRNRGLIEDFFDGDIETGEDWDRRIRKELEQADLILVLISSDFMTSPYCVGVELSRALQRHAERTAMVVPIHVRPMLLKDDAIGALQGLPHNGKPVSVWEDRDSAFMSIASDLEAMIQRMKSRPDGKQARLELIEEAFGRIPREPVVPFVSRQGSQGEDLATWISEQLAAPDRPVLAIWGVGGVGKTTLAGKIARSLIEKFNGRVAWASADGRDGYAWQTLIDEVGQQLGCPPPVMNRERDVRARQVAALINNRAAVIVLDNLETVATDEAARCVEWLTSEVRSPVLITTRDRVTNVRNIPLQAMSPEESRQFLNGLARQSQYPEAVGQYADSIIKMSEANPLVLQWIVSQVDLAQDPVDVFRELQRGEGHAARRVFDRSFDLPQTTDDGRSVLLGLSMFPEPASRPALAHVAGFGNDMPRVNAAIARLASLRLVLFGKTPDRIRIEGLTRELALAKLFHNGKGAQYRQRFVEYFAAFAEEPGEGVEAGDRLFAEMSNIKCALSMAYDIGAHDAVYSITAALAGPVSGVLTIRRLLKDAIELNRRALDMAHQTSDDRAMQFFSHNLGAVLLASGQVLNAEDSLNESLRLARKTNDEFYAASTLNELGTCAFSRGNTEVARSFYKQSLRMAIENQNVAVMGTSLHQLGLLAQADGDLAGARTFLVESLKIKQSQPESISLARTLLQIGSVAEAEENYVDAVRAYEFAVQILRRLDASLAAEAQYLLDLAKRTAKRPPAPG